MGMTNRQFQGFMRVVLLAIDNIIEKHPDILELRELRKVFQSMLEDGTD